MDHSIANELEHDRAVDGDFAYDGGTTLACSDVRLRTAGSRIVRSGDLLVLGDLLPVWDAVCMVLTGILCSAFLSSEHAASLPTDFLQASRNLSLIGGLLSPLLLRGTAGGGDAVRFRSMFALLRVCLGRLAALFGVLLAIVVLLHLSLSLPWAWMIGWLLAAAACCLGARAGVALQVRSLAARGLIRDRVAVVGPRDAALRTVRKLRARTGGAVEIVGIFSDTAEHGADSAGGNDIEALLDLGRLHALDGVILSIGLPAKGRLSLILHELKKLDVAVALCPEVLDIEPSSLGLGYLAGSPFMVLVDRPISHWGLFMKTCIDKMVAGVLLLALLPLMLAVAVAIKLNSPGPVLFRQQRQGRNNAEFDILKFRTMYDDNHDPTGARQTVRGDNRVTAVGRFLRESSLDELPQLLNVLNGTMSLVGPRPLTRHMRTEDLCNTEIIADYEHRHRVKPGITGLAQVNGHRGATASADQVRRRVQDDLRYIDNWSLLLDLKILLITPFNVLFRRQNAF